MLGETLKKIREIRKLSEEYFVKSAGINLIRLKSIENNEENPTKEMIYRFSYILNIPESILLFLNLKNDKKIFKEDYKTIQPIVEELLINLIEKQ